MTRDGIIAVLIGALLVTPLAIWGHIRLSRIAERHRLLSWLAMVSFLAAWLAVITVFTTFFLLVAVMLSR